MCIHQILIKKSYEPPSALSLQKTEASGGSTEPCFARGSRPQIV